MHGMIDLETLGVEPDSVILTLGAIKFDPKSEDEPHSGLYFRINVDEQTALGRTIDPNTLEWWGRQTKEIQEEALGESDRINLDQVTKEINKFCMSCEALWCQGPLFDYAILQNLYKQLGKPCPWNYWQIKDSRTLFGLCDMDPRKDMQTDAHNALADCYYQAKAVQKVYRQFGIKS